MKKTVKPKAATLAKIQEVQAAQDARATLPSALPTSQTRVNFAAASALPMTEKERNRIVKRAAVGQHGLSSALRAALAESAKRDGRVGHFAADTREQKPIGIAMPVAMQYLFAVNVFQLNGAVVQINGPHSSNKSSLLYEFFRWFKEAQGASVLQNTETKFNDQLLRMIVNDDPEQPSVIVQEQLTLEAWQREITGWVRRVKQLMLDDKEGIGMDSPMLFAVDSLGGKPSEETIEKVQKDGAGQRAHPVESLKTKGWSQTITQMMYGCPFALVIVNHVKRVKDAAGNETRKSPGGDFVGYQQGIEIEATKIGQVNSTTVNGNIILLRTYKNSFGPDRRKLKTRLLWHDVRDPETGLFSKVCAWDWDWALVQLLVDAEHNTQKRLRDHEIHVAAPKVSQIENLAWSKTLGMTADDAVPWSELGRRLQADPAVLSKIVNALDIRTDGLVMGSSYFQTQKDADV
jgi:hypothetical protein